MYLGKQVRLRALEREDAETYRSFVNDAEIAQLVDRAKPVTALEHGRWYESLVGSDTAAAFAVEERRGGRFLGLAWLYDIHWRHRRAEVRILLGERRSWGRGRGRDALVTLVGVAFGHLDLEKLWADVLATNSRALGSFEAAGFTREGLLRGDRVQGGERVDVVRLGILRGAPGA